MVENLSGQHVVPIGTYVYVAEDDAYVPDDPWTHPVQLGMLITRLSWELSHGDVPFYGMVSDIKTHKWFGLIKLKEPVYVVCLMQKAPHLDYIWTKNPQLKKPS